MNFNLQLFNYLFHKSIFLLLFSFFHYCSPPDFNNPNDPSSDSYILTQLLRIFLSQNANGSGADSNSGIVKYVAVGLNGQIWSSADGTSGSWKDVSPGITNHLQAIIHNGTKYVAIGGNGQVCASTTATSGSWNCYIAFFNNNMNDLIYANNLFVAVGNNGDIWSSASGDAGTWTDNNSLDVQNFRSIAYSGTLFIVVGDSDRGCSSSTAGSGNWTCGTLNGAGAAPYYGVTYGNSEFVAVGNAGAKQVLYSGTGALSGWTDNGLSDVRLARSITYGSGKFVYVGNNGHVRHSLSGAGTWTDVSPTSDTLYWVTYGQSHFIAVGLAGKIIRSIDGISWTDVSAGGSNALLGVVVIP